jgi:voltage-gated potassium channel
MEERSGRVAEWFKWPLVVAALLVVPVLIVEGSDFGEPWESVALVVNWAIWIAFLAEVVVMLAVVPSRIAWLREHTLDVAIVVLTPPFLPALAGIRLLRLLRLLRLVWLARFVRNVFSLEGVQWASLLTALTALGGGVAFASVESGYSTGDGIYWALTTMTTVGYGDLSPKTDEGKIIAVAVMVVGIGFIALLTGAIAQRFLAPSVERVEEEVEHLDEEEEAVLREVRELGERIRRLETLLSRRS